MRKGMSTVDEEQKGCIHSGQRTVESREGMVHGGQFSVRRSCARYTAQSKRAVLNSRRSGQQSTEEATHTIRRITALRERANSGVHAYIVRLLRCRALIVSTSAEATADFIQRALQHQLSRVGNAALGGGRATSRPSRHVRSQSIFGLSRFRRD